MTPFAYLLLVLGGCSARPALEITNVNVVDVVTGAVMRDASIAIDGDRICRVSRAAEGSGAARIIDGRGRFALPGLRSQAASATRLDRLVGFGITTVDTGGKPHRGKRDLTAELESQVAHGITAREALRSVTVETTGSAPASTGRLTAGQKADLILLEANPLDDIANLRRISLVVLHGRPLGLVELARARAGRSIGVQPFAQ